MNNLDITIVQGATWEDVKLYFPGDLSLGVARGQIRSDYLTKGGVLYCNIEFLPLVYGSVVLPNTTQPVSRTIISPWLSAAKTASLPVPTKQKWLYDIFILMPERSIKIAEGWVTVMPSVTEI